MRLMRIVWWSKDNDRPYSHPNKTNFGSSASRMEVGLAKRNPTGPGVVRMSRPTAKPTCDFEPGVHRRIAVKIIDNRGIESLKMIEIA